LSRGKGISIAGIFRLFRGQGPEENIKILDTSVIIDGRISDVCESGFLEGVFIIPQFILQELQHIADSADSTKRARGRRGLDILHKIQKMSNITVKIIDEDFPKIKEVDSKLVALARLLNAKVITNDFNLNKVAELQGVSVLNINELANALKPVVLPGETMQIFILKEGKEYNQGVAYLDDGTMVVVENGRRLIGKNAEVTVTSVLQTTAGRMIFSKLKEEYEREEFRAVK
ncbi:MAG: TRAM domain-containing protein, partial [Nitrospirota bacterium]|nr:TRAM domain-containing protein [Nitrospirota bacterium]